MLQTGAWIPQMWTGNLPERMLRRVGLQYLCAHRDHCGQAGTQAGTLCARLSDCGEWGLPVDVMLLEHDAFVGELADVGRGAVGVPDLGVRPAEVVDLSGQSRCGARGQRAGGRAARSVGRRGR